MKNLTTFCIVSVLAAFLLTSCGSGLKITKRHYSKGFYISSNHVKSSKTSSGDAENKEVVETENIKESNPSSVKTSIKETRSNKIVKIDNETAAVSSVPEAISEPSEVQQSSAKNHSKSVPDVMRNTASNVKSKFSKTKIKRSNSSGRGYSLLWIVIVVILILWLFGWISGFAAANAIVHLLLLVALILLILWLLRVI